MNAGKIIAFIVIFTASFIVIFTALNDHTAPSPAPCRLPAGSLLPSGDAARINGHTFVCTDGTWVHVTGYGNQP
jgi:hypothetical protein